MRIPFTFLIAALLLGGGSAPTMAQMSDDLRGPRLGAASNFGQGNTPNLLRQSAALGVTDMRDGMNWSQAETVEGAVVFAGPRLVFPDRLAQTGVAAGIVLNWGNPLFDDGDTPYSPEGIEAFGRFAADVVTRFSEIDHLEIGNEFNGTNFVRGPVAEMTAADRARAYVPLLESAARQARAVRPDLHILGGATHSIPAGWLWEMLDQGAGDHMDALALHPYTTPPEQLVRQLAVMRRHPVAASLPVEITEFGSPDPETVAGYFLRDYCQMALGGVTRAVWYPLNDRGDGLIPLITREGRITTAGRAYRLIAARMEGQPVTDIAPDPFTYGCRFGEDVSVIWGMPRDVTLPDGAEVLDPEGNPLTPPFALSENQPLVIVHAGEAPLLGPRGDIAADSFHQFAYPETAGDPAPGDGFERFARRGDQRIELQTLPGQEAPGTPWFPYRGSPDHRPMRMTAESLVPGGGPNNPIDIVHRYVAETPETLRLEARFDVPARSVDGISVRVTLDGTLLEEVSGEGQIEIGLDGLDLGAGAALEIAVGPNGTTRGDVVSYRITLVRP